MNYDDFDTSYGHGDDAGANGESRATRILTDISSRSWEHSADRAALAALRKLPGFDQVLRTLFGIFGEKPVRLAFQANAVRVGPNQFPHLWDLYCEVCTTLDAPERYPLFVSQNPVVNAGAYGMKQPFIILNSGTLELLTDRQVSYVMGHEVGHVMSDHVLYRTMTVLLTELAKLGFPLVGLAARAILIALLEWSRKSELSSDRAGLLAIQEPDEVMGSMLKMAGGGRDEETSLPEFIRQAEDYRQSGDMADQVFKVLNLLGQSHPFWVLRVSELRGWIETGDYDRILRGEYQRRGDPDPAYAEDLAEAADSYKTGAREVLGQMAGAARRAGESFWESFRKQP
ncbi:MAG: M48 family metallopeptidase [Gemmatimonadetes bacterium]|nr:M48 family metallopeptidase [Gemmatimonadota bacterium]MXX72843.1 M48 family metallopeptidase [Gemmatimonadota bacterium]MYC92428.1 M48 family metallopeptidase [Gemmatimonadota bacterium]MYG34438.1 M48 family metallopeptidase [Gemmatimonadota bacterium]MYJ18729.1 M48 family metallopeptidase [Gemmatimonadota bacterium]